MENIKESLEKLKAMNIDLQKNLGHLNNALETLKINLKRLNLELQWAKEKRKQS